MDIYKIFLSLFLILILPPILLPLFLLLLTFLPFILLAFCIRRAIKKPSTPTEDTLSALSSLIAEAEALVDRIESRGNNNPELAARSERIIKREMRNIYEAEWLVKENFRNWEDAHAGINAGIAVLRSLSVEVDEWWLEGVGEL